MVKLKIYIGNNSDEYLIKCINLWRVYDLKKPLKALTVYNLKSCKQYIKY